MPTGPELAYCLTLLIGIPALLLTLMVAINRRNKR